MSRPSSRRFSCKASIIKFFSFREGSASRGIAFSFPACGGVQLHLALPFVSCSSGRRVGERSEGAPRKLGYYEGGANFFFCRAVRCYQALEAVKPLQVLLQCYDNLDPKPTSTSVTSQISTALQHHNDHSASAYIRPGKVP